LIVITAYADSIKGFQEEFWQSSDWIFLQTVSSYWCQMNFLKAVKTANGGCKPSLYQALLATDLFELDLHLMGNP